jgi:hypothetical protein
MHGLLHDDGLTAKDAISSKLTLRDKGDLDGVAAAPAKSFLFWENHAASHQTRPGGLPASRGFARAVGGPCSLGNSRRA